MDRTSHFFGIADLTIVFMYGAALCYTHFFIYSLTMTKLWMASGLLGFFLGSFAPQIEEVLEWIIAFGVGICFALVIPQLINFYNTGQYEFQALLEGFMNGIPFTLQVLTPWIGSLPVGWVFYKITHRNYYRHARFF